jgi:hypothetical protein
MLATGLLRRRENWEGVPYTVGKRRAEMREPKGADGEAPP